MFIVEKFSVKEAKKKLKITLFPLFRDNYCYILVNSFPEFFPVHKE